MSTCDRCGRDNIKNLGAHKRFCQVPKDEVNKTRYHNELKEEKEEDNDILKELKSLRQKIDSMEAMKDLEGTLQIDSDEEQKSQMFIVNKQAKEITGDATEAILKTRFYSMDDVKRSVENYIQRYYGTLQNTRYGGDSILISVEELEDGVWDINDLKKFESEPNIELVNGVPHIRIYIEIASIRETLQEVARIALEGGKGRHEAILQAGAKAEGQDFVEQHTPPPNMYIKPYGQKKNVEEKIVETGDKIFEQT